MTLINIDLRNVAGETGRHDQVVFHAPVHRAGSAGQTIQTAPVIVDLEGGIGSVDLDPGPVVVEIRARGWEDTAPKTVMVPETGPITLTGLLLDAFEWAPVVVSEVRALAQAAEAAATSAEADRVVVEQAATSASWSGDQLTVLGATSPPLTGPQGPKGDKGEKGDPGDGDVLWSELNPVLDGKAAVSHTHSEYATTTTVNGVSSRVTTLENSQPIIVSSLPSSPLPGRIYVVTG